MHRFLFMALCFANAAEAWEFTAGLPCRLTHETEDVAVELTYDPTQPLYTIALTRRDGWVNAPLFAMQFEGGNALAISTDRHVLDEGGTRLTVTDRGFGNVLNGLQFNQRARVVLGNTSIDIPLAGAAEPVDRFRRCEVSAGA